MSLIEETLVVSRAEPKSTQNAVGLLTTLKLGDRSSELLVAPSPVYLTAAVEEQASAGSQGGPRRTIDVTLTTLGLRASIALQNLFQHSCEPAIYKDQRNVFISICNKVASLLIEKDQHVIINLDPKGEEKEEKEQKQEENRSAMEKQTVYVCPTFLNVLHNA